MKLATLKGFYDESITITISSLPCTIGRSRTADFIIAHVNVSRNHCEITKENSLWKISDYSSSGTYINDSLVGKGKSVFLDNGDVIRLGPVESKLCWSFSAVDSDVPSEKNSVNNGSCNIIEIKNNELEKKSEARISNDSDSVVLEENKVTLPPVVGEIRDEKIQELKKESHNIQHEVEEKKHSVQVDKKSDFLENITDVMETELQCTICSELFLTAITLGCTHTFCKYCIDQWKRKQKTCPICRKKITNETRSLVVDNYIDKMIGNLSVELKERREAIIKERSESEPSKKKSKLKTKKT